MLAGDRYIVISADGHAGADLRAYRAYLASRHHDAFDAWTDTFVNPYPDLEGPDGSRNWDSDRRLAEMEDDGIVAEVLYPNTVPPFFPSASLTTQVPAATAGDLELRWAGLQAHNRWLADFCAAAPGRRAGVAQIMLHDVDAAVAEIRWAHGAGLTGGVLLPGVPPGIGLPQLYDPVYEPIWAVCEELGTVVNHHGGSASPPMGPTDVDKVVFLLEVTWWSHRALAHLLVSGALERHPGLRVVFTESGTAWVPDELMRLDYFFDRMSNAGGSQEAEWGRSVMGPLSLRPSEYWARQCYVGASFMRAYEVPAIATVGHQRIMWGSDYPHKEASFPYSRAAMRAAYAGLSTDDVVSMLGANAAGVYGFDLEALAPIAERVGPTVEEIAVPLRPGDVPVEAERCPALAGFGA